MGLGRGRGADGLASEGCGPALMPVGWLDVFLPNVWGLRGCAYLSLSMGWGTFCAALSMQAMHGCVSVIGFRDLLMRYSSSFNDCHSVLSRVHALKFWVFPGSQSHCSGPSFDIKPASWCYALLDCYLILPSLLSSDVWLLLLILAMLGDTPRLPHRDCVRVAG